MEKVKYKKISHVKKFCLSLRQIKVEKRKEIRKVTNKINLEI